MRGGSSRRLCTRLLGALLFLDCGEQICLLLLQLLCGLHYMVLQFFLRHTLPF